MLIEFNFENFKSYSGKTNLLLTTSSKIRKKNEHKIPVNSLNVLKYAGIYGDNASGKTNVVEAIGFFQSLVCFPNVNIQFPFDTLTFKGNENKPSKFRCVFSIKSVIYEYGFEVQLGYGVSKPHKILKEFLNIIGSGPARSKYLFDSSNREVINKSILKDEQKPIFNILYRGYKELNKMNPSKLFLSFINESDKRAMVKEMTDVFVTVYDFIRNNIVVIGANAINLNFFSRDSLETINKYTKQFDKGLDEIKLTELSIDFIKSNVPPQILEQVNGQLNSGRVRNATLSLNNRDFYFISKGSNDSPIKYETLALKHKYIDKPFSFSEESEGTRKFIVLMSYFSNFKDKVFVIDELERSMHPSSSKYLFNFFEKETKNSNTQFIFTSHNISFMDDNLRHDEIYFADKDMYGSSILYGLTDFKTTSDQQTGKLFKDGVYRKVSENRKV